MKKDSLPDAPTSPCDVFLSYSSADKAWVRGELLPRIEQAGLTAFIDYRDFTRGAPSINEMERGVLECRKTLLILTPAYIESEWCEIESIMTATLSPANRDLRLIPLLKADCQKPLRIGALTHIDFTPEADHALAWLQLLTALGAPPEPEPPTVPQRDDWLLAHPYAMPPHFTGRQAERAHLSRWLAADSAQPLLVLRALGGFGKTALAWHWLTHDLAPAQWPRVVWWSFYENDATFAQFLAETLPYLSGGKIDPTKLSAKDAVRALLQLLRAPGTLLVLDGFERELRAFSGLDAAYQGDSPGRAEPPPGPNPQPPPRDPKATDAPPRLPAHQNQNRHHTDRDCLSPLAETFLHHLATLPGLRAKVLLTTRLRPHVLETRDGDLLQGCHETELKQLHPDDAVGFFLARGIRGTPAEIRQACGNYGFHPLSLRLLSGLIVKDFTQPGDIAAARRLDVSGDLVQRQHHVLETAYDQLTPALRLILSQLACFRSPVSYATLTALAETAQVGRGVLTAPSAANATERRAEDSPPAPPLDSSLRDLVARGLVQHESQTARFDLHPIVRRYAYDRLAAPDRAAAHTRLRDYFAAVPPPDKVTRLEDLTPVIELYHHTVRAGQFDEAFTLFADHLNDALYYQLGAYVLIIDLLRALFPDGEDRPPRLKNESDQAWTLNALANSYSLSGQPRRAVPLFEQHIAIREKQGNKSNLAIGLGAVASVALLPIGALRAAEANLRRSIALLLEIKNEFQEAIGHQELGRLLAYRGASAESETELATALQMAEKEKHAVLHGGTWAYRALRKLLHLRQAACGPNLKSEISDLQSPLAAARRALELADEWARTNYPLEREYIRAHWLLGAAHRVAGQPDAAESHLHEALERCRRTNCVEAEADILIDLARLRAATGAPDEAQRLAEEALLITERSGYVLQGADAHLELARLALARADRPTARTHAHQALTLATCDGPPFTYAAAHAEATTLLAQLQPH